MKKLKERKKKEKVSRVYSSKKMLGVGKDAGIDVRSWRFEEKKTNFQTHSPNQLLNLSTINQLLVFLFVLLLPTQLGKHFFFDFSYLSGVRVDYLAPTIYFTDVFALALIILNLKSVITYFRQKNILLLISFLLFNVLISQFFPISVYRYIKILELVGLVAVFKRAKISLRMLIFAFLIGGVFELTVSTAQFISKHSLQGVFYFLGERPLSLSMPGIAKTSLNGIELLRPYGTFSHPNSLAGFYLFVYFYVLTKSKLISTNFNPSNKLRVNRFQQISTNLLLLVSSLLIFISFAKIAIITFLILNLIYLWKSSVKKTCKFCFFSRIFILLIVSLIFLQATSDQFTLAKRIHLAQNALILIRQHSIFGVGLGNYLISQNQFSTKYVDLLNQPVHNIFLLILSELGIAITLLLLLTFQKELKRIFVKFPYILSVVLLTGVFDHYWLTLQQNFLLLSLLAGVL